MLTSEKIKEAYSEMVKSIYIENFQRQITEEELDEGFEDIFLRMLEDLKDIRGYTESEFERYMTSKSNELLFSPALVHNEMARILKDEGEEILAKSVKYKRLREMEVASRLCFAHYKLRSETFLIKAQDNPDIVLALANSSSKKIEILQVEIMTVPEEARRNLIGELPTAIAEFIRSKKFLKAYGRCSLMVNLDFDQMGFSYTKVSEEIKNIDNNPYESIWLTCSSDQEGGMSVIHIFPGIVKVEYNLRKESLFY